MTIPDDRTRDEGPMAQFDLNFGSDFVSPSWPPDGGWQDWSDASGDHETHVFDVLDIAGRRYVLECRLCRTTRVVLGYSLRPWATAALA